MTLPITAKDLRTLPDSEVAEILKSLGPAKNEELRFNWEFWARPEQLEPKGDWNAWLLSLIHI